MKFLLLLFLLATACEAKELTASWYQKSKRRDGLMANGHRFDPKALTAASWYYPLGTRLKVVGPYGPVVVEVTDSGPHKRLLKTRQIDLSRQAFALICPLDAGLIGVTVEVIP